VVHFCGCLPALVWKPTIERSWIGEGGGRGINILRTKIARFTFSNPGTVYKGGKRLPWLSIMADYPTFAYTCDV